MVCQMHYSFLKNYLFLAAQASYPTACGILVPQPGIEHESPALAGRFFNHWTTTEVQHYSLMCFVAQPSLRNSFHVPQGIEDSVFQVPSAEFKMSLKNTTCLSVGSCKFSDSVGVNCRLRLCILELL